MTFPFNPKPSTYLHLDLNSCFATIEQQANPLLRHHPIVVAAYTGLSGCILSPSIEAKILGIKVGMQVKEGRLIYPKLTVLPPDPWKYRFIHLELKRLLSQYTNRIYPKSIDEFTLNLEGFPAFNTGLINIAHQIKQSIKTNIGDWLTVSVGIGPNAFLAKTAAGLHKPDGLDEINQRNYFAIFQSLQLTDLCGIKTRNAAKLNCAGIFTVIDFYQSSAYQLQTAFQSILGYYWYLRLHGWEIDDIMFDRHSFGNSYTLPQPLTSKTALTPIIMKLTQKTSQRLRQQGYCAGGIHFSLLFKNGTHWHRGVKTKANLFATNDIYKHILHLFDHCPHHQPVSQLAISCFNLTSSNQLQLDLFNPSLKQFKLYQAIDKINHQWGDYVITPATMLNTDGNVTDRIAFGSIKELEEIISNGYNDPNII